jgi:tRNA threonylcarbamoyladenosine biosynthesis protein TsaB
MILALRTAGPTTFMNLIDSTGAVIAAREWESARQLADELIGTLTEFLVQNSTDFTGLAGIIIFSGPGSFTSLRIGHTVVNALASNLGIPVVGTGGDQWITEGTKALTRTPVGVIAMPFYGAEAHVTRPKG